MTLLPNPAEPGSNYTATVNSFQNKFNVRMDSCKPIVEQLETALNNGKNIYEYLGVYYQDDNADEPEINKTEKKVITYKVE